MATQTASITDAVDSVLRKYGDRAPSLKKIYKQLYLLDELKGWCITTHLLSKSVVLISVLDDDHNIVVSRTIKVQTTQ